FPRFLPAGTTVAMKTGSVNASRTCAGIIYVPKPGSDPQKKEKIPVAVCVMTDENKDQRWVADNAGDVLCAKVAKSVYDYYAGKGPTSSLRRNDNIQWIHEMSKSLNVGVIGYGFMGRAHSNAYCNAGHFFDLPYRINLKAACGRDAAKSKAFADRWGYD